MPLYDFAAMSEEQNRATDRERAKRNHEVNRKTRTKERKGQKERMSRYTESARKKKKSARKDKFVLSTVKATAAVVQTPRSQALYELVPTATEFPTAKLVGAVNPVLGTGIPWSSNPMAMGVPFFNDVIGTIMVMIGTRMVAAMAAKVSGSDISGVEYTVGQANVRLRHHTGRGAGRGAYVRPRAEGGASPDDDADPYEQPSEWWEFWKWTF